MRERFRFGAVLIGAIAQIIGGVLIFGFAPQIIFVDISGNNLALLSFRLAAYGNISMALITLLILYYAPEPRLLRWLAAGGALYQLLAGLDSLRTALGLTGVNVVEPVLGLILAHSFMFLLLISSALLPEQ